MVAEPIVFVVDDEPAVVKALTEMVEMIGLNVASYNSAGEFLEAYQPAGPGCLVLNVSMPGMSGLELQKELVRTGSTLPIIVITGHGDTAMAEEAMKAGAIDFLAKPFRMQTLRDSIHKAIELDSQRWRLREQ